MDDATLNNEITLPAEGLTDAKTFAAFLKISPSMLNKLRTHNVIRPPVKIGDSARWCVQYVREIKDSGLEIPAEVRKAIREKAEQRKAAKQAA